jgi:threonine dehydratase
MPCIIAIFERRTTVATSTDPLGLSDVFIARRRLSGRVRRTPLQHSAWLSDAAGGEVHLKLESLQITNSFKLRGAFNAALALLERLGPGESPPMLVTASAGNHGLGLACAARQLGLRTVVYTPKGAPRAKLDAIRRHGADLRPEAETYEDSERLAKQFASSTGAPYISPYSHPDILAGAGTVGLEIVEDLPDVDLVVVPVGGGGLVAAIATVIKAVSPRIEVVGIEAEASHPFADSLRAGHIVEVAVGPSIADGLVGNMDPETVTFSMVQRLVDRMALVSEEQMVTAIRGLVAHEHLVAEGAGAAAVGAVLGGRVNVRGRRAAIVITGSNIDRERLARLLAPQGSA